MYGIFGMKILFSFFDVGLICNCVLNCGYYKIMLKHFGVSFREMMNDAWFVGHLIVTRRVVRLKLSLLILHFEFNHQKVS